MSKLDKSPCNHSPRQPPEVLLQTDFDALAMSTDFGTRLLSILTLHKTALRRTLMGYQATVVDHGVIVNTFFLPIIVKHDALISILLVVFAGVVRPVLD